MWAAVRRRVRPCASCGYEQREGLGMTETTATSRGQKPTAQVSDAARQALATAATGVFDKLRKSIKQVLLYRHNTDRYAEYYQPFCQAMEALLAEHRVLSLKVDAQAFKVGPHFVYEDDSRENNVCYPLFVNGIRLLVFKAGVSADVLMRFFMLCIQASDDAKKGKDDIVTTLWKANLDGIEYVVVEGFKALPDEDPEEVEIEIEKVVAYLYRQLQSNSDDYQRFARVAASDLDLVLENVDTMRGAEVKGVTAKPADKARLQQALAREESAQLPKLVVVLFQLLELDTREDNFEDVAEAFVQLLDALLLQGNFTAIEQIRARFIVSAQKPQYAAEQRDLIERCGERFRNRMAESQRIEAIGTYLNAGVAKDVAGVKAYLSSLGTNAIPPLLDMLESLQFLPNRRLVCDVLAELGKDHVSSFELRLEGSSNLVKDALYIIDKIDPPNKFTIFARVLNHENAVLRLETLSIIGRNDLDECLQYVVKTLQTHPDPAMRAQAARLLPNYSDDRTSAVVVERLQDEKFDKFSDGEQRALFDAVVQMRAPAATLFVRETLEQKSGLFRRGNDDSKLLLLQSLETHASVVGLNLLASLVQDPKRHSAAVNTRAIAALQTIRTKLGV
jgi:hypothetical protein